MIATRRPVSRAASRIRLIACACSEGVPCEKFNRATSIPARMSRASISGDSDAGPMVATILVLCAGSAAFMARTLCSLWPEIAPGPLQALGHCRLREREMRARVIHFLLSPSVGCEICGVRDWISDHWLIRHNNCCPRLQLVCELLGKLGVETDSGSNLLGFDGPAFAVDAHPSAGLASGRELTWFAGAAFKH